MCKIAAPPPPCSPSSRPQTATLLAVKDAVIRQTNVTRNEGHSPLLRLRGDPNLNTRVLLGFDASGINLAQVKSAIIEMTIAGNDALWGNFGGTLDAFPISTDFA